MSDLTPFEQHLSPNHKYLTIYEDDGETVIGYYRNLSGVEQLCDREGKVVWSDEIGVEQCLLDPIDLVGPGIVGMGVRAGVRLTGRLAARIAARTAARGASRAATGGVLARLRSVASALAGRAASEALRYPLQVTKDTTAGELKALLARLWEELPALQQLHRAQLTTADMLQRETFAALQGWARQVGVTLQVVEEGAVQKLTKAGNFSSLQGTVLKIERQVLREPERFWEEAKHEICAFVFGKRPFPAIKGIMEGVTGGDILEVVVERGPQVAFETFFF
jgi:hypothetical protein